MSAVEELVYLLDEAFAGEGIRETNEAQSLLVNLRSVEDPMWRMPPPGGSRTIESIALHVGECKVMYDDYAFGPGTLHWDDGEVRPWPVGEAPMSQAIAWLESAHRKLVGHVAALDDVELGQPRLANWGEEAETRWLISMLLQHDTYHAGEINHLRSVLARDDGWRWTDS